MNTSLSSCPAVSILEPFYRLETINYENSEFVVLKLYWWKKNANLQK